MTPPRPRTDAQHPGSRFRALAGAALLLAVLASLAALAVDDDAMDTVLGAVAGFACSAAVGLLLAPAAGRRAARRARQRAGAPVTGHDDQDVLDRLEPLRAARRDDA